MSFQPAYLKLLAHSELEQRAATAYRHLEHCDLCARYCRVDRRRGLSGVACHTEERALVYKMEPHCGSAGQRVRDSDAGAIFFSFCNMSCIYCKKREVSQKGMGWEVEPEELANMLLALQEKGSRNISLVSPSHVIAQILAATEIAARRGLKLPLVFESDAYDSPEGLALLDGVIDVYMPDIKYGDPQAAEVYSHSHDYVEVSRRAVREMYRQVGDFTVDDQGMAQRGLLVRHLVLPGNLDNTRRVLEFVVREISPHCAINLIPSYQPCHAAAGCPPLDRRLTVEEYREILDFAAGLGLRQIPPPSQGGN